MSWQPDLESLRLLVLVREHGSLTAAATLLGISQPAASKRLGLLERRLGVQLLVRTRQGTTTTEAGELVAGWARRVLDELDVLVSGTAALRRETASQLSVAASLTIAEHLLPAWLGELRARHPALHVGLEVTNSARVCALLRSRAVDVGFVESPDLLPGLASRTIARDRLVLVVAPSHPWARRDRPVPAIELARTALVSREAGSGTRETVERALVAAGADPAPPLLELGSSAAVRSTVLTGAGPALLSRLVVAPDIAGGSLIEIPVTGINLTRALRAVWHSGARLAGAAAVLVEVADTAWHRGWTGRP